MFVFVCVLGDSWKWFSGWAFFFCVFSQIYLTDAHTYHFNGHFPGKPGL